MCALSNRENVIAAALSDLNDGIGKPIANLKNKAGLSYDDMLNEDFVFDMDSHDVMVFLHMQKTGELNLLIEVGSRIANDLFFRWYVVR